MDQATKTFASRVAVITVAIFALGVGAFAFRAAYPFNNPTCYEWAAAMPTDQGTRHAWGYCEDRFGAPKAVKP